MAAVKMSKNKTIIDSLMQTSTIAHLQPDFINKLLNLSVNQSVEEAFSHLLTEEDEKKKQNKASGKIDKLDLRAERDDEVVQDEQEEVEVEEKTTDTSSPKVKAQKLPSAMEPEDIAKMLNIIRAGKSLKDPDVKERFDVWWDALSPPEKIALKGFLDGIAQIIAGDTEAKDASHPAQEPYNVQMTSAPKEKPRRIQNKKTGKSTSSDEPAGIDSPIIVGEVNSTREIKKKMIK